MILFIIVAICILLYTTFADDWLIYHIKNKTRPVFKTINTWFWSNIGFNIVNIMCVFGLSIMMFFVVAIACPSETSHWEFNINAMQDNLVTEGTFARRGRGSVDGELSYFYSRTMSLGEKIEHIPANKTYVRYSDNERPHVEVHQSCVDIPDWLSKVFFLEWMNSKSTDYYILVLPEGTIANDGQYEIDMK